MDITGSVALVTGANRGLGHAFVQALRERGARKIYATSRAGSVEEPGVTPLRLDITDPESIAHAAAVATDVDLLINNAGISTGADLLRSDLQQIRSEMDTHYFGTLAMSRAFAPVLAAQGGGAILNVLSVLSWTTTPTSQAYSAAKSAAWSMTNSLRVALADAGTQVTALHVGYMQTDMAAHVDGPKADPAQVAGLALDGVAAGAPEVLADALSRQVQAALAGGVPALYPQLAG